MILENALLAKEKLKSKTNEDLINKAKLHESRLRLHALSYVNNSRHSGTLEINREDAFLTLTGRLQRILPPDKYDTVLELMQPPFKSNKVVKKIFNEVSKVFEGQNRFFDYDFKSENNKDKFLEYIKEFDDNSFWQQEGVEALKHAIHSIIIVDRPREQKTDTPEPYYYLLPIQRVVSLEINQRDGSIEWIAFTTKNGSEKEISIYCDEYYRVYDTKNDEFIVDVKHELGEVPAKFFLQDLLNPECDKIQREGILSNSLTDLDDYLRYSVFKEYADLYGAFPILVTIDAPCTVPGCVDGIVELDEKTQFTENGEVKEVFNKKEMPCPSCSGVQNFGPGSALKKPPRRTSDDPDYNNALEMISPDTKNLEYLANKLDHLDKDIYLTSIGAYQNSPDSKQFNEDQVRSLYDQKINVLMKVKKVFEEAHKWANTMLAKAMYGKDSVKEVTVFYGDEFYLKTVGDISKDYEIAKTNGEPQQELHTIYLQKIKTKYKGNPIQLKKALLLAEINPIPHLSIEDAVTMLEKGVITQIDFIIKINFTKFVNRFEREQKNSILSFGENTDHSTKVQAVISEFEKYAQEQIVEVKPEPEDGSQT